MRKIVIAKALVLAIFGLYLAVAMVKAPDAEDDRAHNDNGTLRITEMKAGSQTRCQASGSG